MPLDGQNAAIGAAPTTASCTRPIRWDTLLLLDRDQEHRRPGTLYLAPPMLGDR